MLWLIWLPNEIESLVSRIVDAYYTLTGGN